MSQTAMHSYQQRVCPCLRSEHAGWERIPCRALLPPDMQIVSGLVGCQVLIYPSSDTPIMLKFKLDTMAQDLNTCLSKRMSYVQLKASGGLVFRRDQ